MIRFAALLPLLPLVLPLALSAAGTMVWEMSTYTDFQRGRFEGVSLSRDGRLVLAPRLETVFSSDQPVIWSLAEAPDGSLYAATGHRGRVYRIDPAGKSSLYFTAEQPEIFALALDAAGALFAAASPGGKIFRIENGKAAEYFATGARYVWSLAVGPDGALYAGTGDEGKIFRVTAPGKGELWYDTGQAHVTGLALDPQGRLLAGSEPNGILYRVSARDRAFVLYDAALPEIRAIRPAADGTIYAAALGGSIARRAQAATPNAQEAAAPAAAVSTSITVSADVQAGGLKPQQEPAKPQPAPQVSAQFTPMVDIAGIEKSAIYRINPDNTVETLWTSKEENVYDLLPAAGDLLVSTDLNGRIYRLAPDRKTTLLAQTNEGEATRLLRGRDASVLAATGNLGRLYRLGQSAGSSGVYQSPVHDAGAPARWGSLAWRASGAGEGVQVAFETRSGNSARPDKTWSDWSAQLTRPAGSAITSPNARYIQWRASFSGAGGASPVLHDVSLAYLPQNSAPLLRSLQVSTQVAALAGKGAVAPAAPAAPASVYTVTVTDSGEATAAASAGTPTQTLERGISQQVQLAWQAEDLDGDRLVYSLSFLGEGETQWKPLKRELHENAFVFDAEALADGKYLFRVKASDREANPPASAREAEIVSAPVLIDHTPPVVTASSPRVSGKTVEIDLAGSDTASPLRRAEYSLDAASWVPVEAADGVIDSARENFRLRIENLAAGEHLVVVRVFDSAGNAGLARVLLSGSE
ncbi:MAG: WD40 repeat domain-containing protein [Acidobacteria bacterium]|nr:WD40 repeat domain-containing protein [Acidobacteriota bacterium]